MARLHVYKTVNDGGKGTQSLSHVASVETWRETHAPRGAAFNEAAAMKHACTTYVYDSAGKMLCMQRQRGTL